MRVVAHAKGALAHCILFPVGFESSLAVGLGGECSKSGAHLLEVRYAPGDVQVHGRLVLPQLAAPGLIQLPQDHRERIPKVMLGGTLGGSFCRRSSWSLIRMSLSWR